nr:MAG TPA: SPATIAL protein [Caudoviricetes sp.]
MNLFIIHHPHPQRSINIKLSTIFQRVVQL